MLDDGLHELNVSIGSFIFLVPYIYINTLYLVLYFAFSRSKVKYLPLKNLLKRYFVLKLIKKPINKLLGEETNLSSKLLYYVTTCKNHKWSQEHLS